MGVQDWGVLLSGSSRGSGYNQKWRNALVSLEGPSGPSTLYFRLLIQHIYYLRHGFWRFLESGNTHFLKATESLRALQQPVHILPRQGAKELSFNMGGCQPPYPRPPNSQTKILHTCSQSVMEEGVCCRARDVR